MNTPPPDDLEDSIRRQAVRSLPAAWRTSILDSARVQAEPVTPSPAPAKPLGRLLRDWLWPHPYAWATLAALWMVIASLQWSGSEQALAKSDPTVLLGEDEYRPILALHRQLWSEFVDALSKSSKSAAHPSELLEEPRSQGRPAYRQG